MNNLKKKHYENSIFQHHSPAVIYLMLWAGV